MLHPQSVFPQQLFDAEVLNKTYSFLKTLKHPEIVRLRDAYRREMNKSNDDNVLPETTLEQRRCFLYLTNHHEHHNY